MGDVAQAGQQADGSHTHSLAFHTDGHYQIATAVVKEVDKLEAAYALRISHVRALLNHLGQEAEKDVMELFNNFPVSHGE